jgi:UDP-GlcNAc3NAcA epimerase
MAKLLARVGREERPVVLSLHPGTAAAMSAAGIALGGWVRVIPPVGYRSSLTLQLYASAVITDSGGVQREASWLGTPCLVVRLTTEWVEMVSAPGATSVIVGLDADRAVQELAVRSPLGDGRRSALRRARELDLRPGRAAQMIAESLAASM